jgi:ADP-ribose pyrophosphatase YjhB (NUDIX family)
VTPGEVPCVGAIARDDVGRLLLIRRANPPAQGLWSLAGGRVEAGESWEEAVVREFREETGLEAVVERHMGDVRRDAPDGRVYVIRDFLVAVLGSTEPQAGDDALDVAWFTEAELSSLDTSPGLVEALTEWGILSG